MLKDDVRTFWEQAACGEALYLSEASMEGFKKQSEQRYELEPYIVDFASFGSWKQQKVLEIGVGLGADHQRFAEGGADLYGIDLTEKSVEFAKRRLGLFRLHSKIEVGDAEALRFSDNTFDLVYSWGVIHHSPNTKQAADEILRVLRPGGKFKVMIYHKYSFVGYMLWIRYALLRLKPWLSLEEIYGNYLESPGTKAYTVPAAKKLFNSASKIQCRCVLMHGDLLASDAGQSHRGVMLTVAKLVWPRRLIQRFFPNHGLFMIMTGEK